MIDRPDIAIIGAGIVGAACAFELAAQGLDVLVLDKASTGSGTTAAGMGHIVVMDDSPAELALSALSRQMWLELAPALDKRQAFVKCGTLWIAADDEEMALARSRLSVLQSHGVGCDMLTGEEVGRKEPALRKGLAGGMLVHDDAMVYAPAVADWLLTQSLPGRIELRLDAEVMAIAADGLHLSGGDVLPCGSVIVAAGLDAAALVPRLPLEGKKGHLLITDRYPGLVNHQILELGYIKTAHLSSGTSVAFNVQPRPTGQLLIGSSRQFDNLDSAVQPEILAQMIERAVDYMPVLRQLNVIRAWTGLRPTSPDGLPLIGKVTSAFPGLWVAVGHEGLGVTTALATAKLLTAQMLGKTPPLDPAPYLASRFDTMGVLRA